MARLRSALLGEAIPDERTALLVSTLVDVHFKRFVPKNMVREARRHATEILERLSAGERAIVSAAAEAVSNADAYTSST